jgi:hypothetical protein
MDQQGERALTRRAGDEMSGTDAWSRAARRVREMATRLELALDEEELALQDVRDLQALHERTLRRTVLHTGKEDTVSLQGYGVTEGYDHLLVAHQAGIRRAIAAAQVARQVEAGRRVGLFTRLLALLTAPRSWPAARHAVQSRAEEG